MRAKTQMFQPERGWSGVGYHDYQTQMSDDLRNMLAWASVDFVEIHHNSGLITRYWHWEYDCTWCGSYDHASEDCPDLDPTDDDDLDAPVDDASHDDSSAPERSPE